MESTDSSWKEVVEAGYDNVYCKQVKVGAGGTGKFCSVAASLRNFSIALVERLSVGCSVGRQVAAAYWVFTVGDLAVKTRHALKG